MDISWETVLAYAAGAAIVVIVAYVTHIKAKGVTKIVLNSLAGGVFILGLSALNVIVLPFNIFNALLVGVLGLPGAAVVVAAAVML